MSITSQTSVCLSTGVFQTPVGVVYCVTRRGSVNILPLKSIYRRLQILPHLEPIFIKVTSASSCFLGLDWQFDIIFTVGVSWFVMQWWPAWCRGKVHDPVNAPKDIPEFAIRISIHWDGVKDINHSFHSQAGEYSWSTAVPGYCSDLEAYLVIMLLFFCFFTHAYMHAWLILLTLQMKTRKHLVLQWKCLLACS